MHEVYELKANKELIINFGEQYIIKTTYKLKNI